METNPHEQFQKELEKLEASFANWNWEGKSDEEKRDWVTKAVVVPVARIMLSGDSPIEIVAQESLIPDISRFILEVEGIPEVVFEGNDLKEKLTEQDTELFLKVLQSVPFSGAKIEHLAAMGPAAHDTPEGQFLRFGTQRTEARAQLYRWDQKRGFRVGLVQKGIQQMPDEGTLNLMMLIDHLLDLREQQSLTEHTRSLLNTKR